MASFRYATGDSLNHYSTLIHEFYSKEITQSANAIPAVHLLVDTELTKDSMDVTAYISRPNLSEDTEDDAAQAFDVIPIIHSKESELCCKPILTLEIVGSCLIISF
jgi:hypothetical protein